MCSVSHHGVCGVEYVEEAFADGRGEDVVLHSVVPRSDPSQSEEHSQRRAHAEEVFNLQLRAQSEHVRQECSRSAPVFLFVSLSLCHCSRFLQ